MKAQQGFTDVTVWYTNSSYGASLGQYFYCTAVVYNAGYEPATNVMLTNWTPAGLQFVGATTSTGTFTQNAGVVTCNFGILLPTASATLTMEFKAPSLGWYTNVAAAGSDTPDSNPTNQLASFGTYVTAARFFAVGHAHTGYYLPTVTPLPNSQALIVGAPLNHTADVYSATSRQFILPGPTQSLHSHHTATMMNNGLVLIVGGDYAPFIPELYNPSTKQFSATVGNTYAPRWFHQATLLNDGRVLLCGNAYPPLTNEVFDPVSETFSLAPNLQCSPTGTLLPNGQYLTVDWGAASLYDPVTGITTNTIGTPIEVRSYHTQTLLSNGTVLVAGGQIYNHTVNLLEYATTSAEIYDPVSGTFTPTAPMTVPHREHGACALPDGTALIAGGITNGNGAASDRADIFDPNGTINVPGVGVSDASVVEGNAGATNWMLFNVWLTTTSALPVTVDFSTADGTAESTTYGVANLDYSPTNGTLTFAPGQTNVVVPVGVIGDNVQEPNEYFTLNIGAPTQAWLVRSAGVGTIIDDDPTPSLSIAPATVYERDTGLTNLVLTVTLSAQSLSNVTVDYFTSDVTATAGSDYLATSGTLVFNSGDTVKTILVPVIGDLIPEPDETLQVTLTNVQNALIGVGQATGTILNDDGIAGNIHHFDVSPIGPSQVQTVGFPVTLTARDSFGGTVSNYSGLVELFSITTNVVATNLDFEQPTLSPWTVFNNTPYTDRPFQQTLYDVAGYGKLSTAFRTIAGGGSNGITQNVWLAGGNTYTVQVNAAQAMEEYDMSCLGAAVYLGIGPTNVGWGSGMCYPGTNRSTLSLTYTPPTNGFYLLQLTISRDYYYNDALAVYLDDVRISTTVITPNVVTNSFTNGVWSGLVAAQQPAPNVTLEAYDTEGHKGFSNPFNVQSLADFGLSVTQQVQGTLPLRTGMKLQFNLAITNRGPSGVSNVVVAAQVVSNLTFLAATNVQGSISNFPGGLNWTLPSFPVGSNFAATLVYRADIPGDFTNQFNVLSSVLDLNPADNSVALSNHIAPPLLAIGNGSGTEAGASTTGMVFQLTLSGPSAQAVSANYFTADGTASNGVDYVGTNGTVTFAPGTTNGKIVVYTIDNILQQPNRTFSVVLTNPVNTVLSNSTAVGTIIDDDPPPTISIADTAVVEGDSGTTNAVFQLALSKPAVVAVTVHCATATNTASANDFIATNGTVTFPAFITNATFTVAVLGDTVNEPNETFFVNLSSPANATIARAQAVGTIINDDAVPGRLDHFTWDTVPSPRYQNWPFTVALHAVDYLGNPASNGVGSAMITAQTQNGYQAWLLDDFEDGDSVGWTNFSSTFTAIVTNETAAQGSNSLRLTGSTASGTAGLRHTIGTNQPNRITFSARVGQTNQIAGRFTAFASGLYRSAVFFFNNNGQMGLLDAQRVLHSVPYQSNQWYQVDLYFNWASQRVDCRINGALVITNVSFPDSISTMDAVLLANADNTTSWWDDIRVFNDNLTNVFTLTPTNFTGFVNTIKTNSIMINGTGTNVFLTADDGLEHVGSSSLFNLLPVNLTLQTPASITEGNPPVGAQVSIPVAFPQAISVNLTSTAPTRLILPSSLVITANQTNAAFNVGIVDDTIPNWVKTEFISANGTNVAAATNGITLIDNDPAPGVSQYGLLGDGRFQIGVQGPPMQSFSLMASSNLLNWTSVSSFTFTNGPLIYIDPASTNLDHRFYRLVPGP